MGMKPRNTAGGSFSSVVRTAVREVLPQYQAGPVTGSSGPVLAFLRPTHDERPQLREYVAFQKGLHGARWLRVNFWAEYAGTMKGGQPGSYELGHGSPAVRGNSSDVDFDDYPQLADWLRSHLIAVDERADEFFRPFEDAYGAIDALCGNMVALYKDWFDERGANFPPERYADAEGETPVFKDFESYLASRKLTLRTGADYLLWRFWHGMRPMRREEFIKGDYHDCSQCSNFASRGTLAPSHDPVFGPYVEFVCSRHSKDR